MYRIEHRRVWFDLLTEKGATLVDHTTLALDRVAILRPVSGIHRWLNAVCKTAARLLLRQCGQLHVVEFCPTGVDTATSRQQSP
jgi:hypothetical protein